MLKTLKSLFAKIKAKALILNKFISIPYLFFIIIGIVLVIGLFLFFKKKKKKKIKEKKAKPSLNFLKKIWKEFLYNIPKEFRRSISLYKHFIVFGESGSGKTELITTYTDWRGQAQQFYPSYTTNPDLQIYLSSHAVVQEIPAWILKDISKDIRIALKKLWKNLPKNSPPEVIITLNILDLTDGISESLKNYAQTVRGKINIISETIKKPVKFKLALTHLDHIEGYNELVDFLGKNGYILKLTGENLTQLKQSVLEYENLLPHILTSCSASSYLKIISFLKSINKLLPILEEFLKIINVEDPLSITPVFENIYLTSIKTKNIEVTNPFTYTDYQIKSLQEKLPLFKHKIAAFSIGVLLIGGLTGLFSYEFYTLKKITKKLTQIETHHIKGGKKFLHLMLKKINKDENSFISSLFPLYFSKKTNYIKDRCIRDLNDLYIYPHLNKIIKTYLINKTNKNAIRAIYCLGLLYSTNKNSLSKLTLNNISKFSKMLDIKPNMIKDYIYYNLYSLNKYKINNIPIIVYDFNKDVQFDENRLFIFFEMLDSFLKSNFMSITPSSLDLIKKEAYYLYNGLNRIDAYKLLFNIAYNLKSKCNIIILGKDIFNLNQIPIKKILLYIIQQEVSIDPIIFKYNLFDFIEYINTVQNSSLENLKNKIFYCNIKNKKFYFSTKKWHTAIIASELSFIIKKYIRENEESSDLIFFKNPSSFNDIFLNPANNGNFLFSGKAEIRGIYTKEAFNLAIAPLLDKVNKIITKLPVAENEKKLFLNFIYSKTELYAQNYAQQYITYLNAFSINTESLGELKLVLVQLLKPQSPLLNLLLTVKENTELNLNTKNPFILPFNQSLSQFEWVWRVVREEKGFYPEYEKYKLILSQMTSEINQDFTPQFYKINRPGFYSLLSPLGKITYNIYLNKKDSYLNLVKMWLESIDVPTNWHKLFTSPILEAYSLGLKEIENRIITIWNSLLKQDILPILKLFPFNKNTKDMVSVEELKKVTDPNGHFLSSYNKLLKEIVNRKKENFWSTRNNLIENITLPSNMLPTVDFFTQLSKKLWTKDGLPKPITVYIKPLPLPKIINSDYVPILSYIKIGQSSVLGFNQRPLWQKIEFKWWKKQDASIGVKLSAKEESIKIKEISVVDSWWSLYMLLKSTSQYSNLNGKILYEWKFDLTDLEPEKKEVFPPIKIKFLFKTNPWNIFSIPISLY